MEAARQHGGILDGHGGALRHIRRHRVAGIAEQRHLAVRPAVERFPVDDGPFVHVGTSLQHPLDLAVEAGERLAQFPDVTLGRP